MSISDAGNKRRCFARMLPLTLLVLPWSLAHAEKSMEERRPADPQGMVEVSNIAGSVDVIAWDRPEVEVSGTFDEGVDRVEVRGGPERTSIHVVLHAGGADHRGEARLVVHVPANSALAATLIAANLKLSGVRGAVKVQTVSGNVGGDIGGELVASTVNGSVRLTARHSGRVEVKTISGDVQVSGVDGEMEVTTVSGNTTVDRATLTRGRFKSISGKVSADLTLAPAAELVGESVSGNIVLNFAPAPDAEFDVRTFSGQIENCFGPAPEKSRYGSGSRLAFKNGDARSRVHVDTQAGNVKLCTAAAHDKRD